MRERTVESALKREGRLRGVWVIKSETLHVGFPDRLLIGHGRVAFVELKAPGRKLRKGQEIVRGWLFQLGFVVHVIDHPDDVRGFFDRWLA